MTPSWLGAATARLRGAYTAGRLPHALLIHEAPGAGGEWLAGWAARMVLGTSQAAAADQHPDLMTIRPIEESTQIRIEQVRELASELALTAHQGGYKVGILSPADSMNRFAANALLKTLEEPPRGTLLILVAHPAVTPAGHDPQPLPAGAGARAGTGRSRRPGSRRRAGPGDWERVLGVLGTAPLAAAEADPAAVAAGRRRGPPAGSRRPSGAGADPVATAERWARSELTFAPHMR